jgi:intraflagellar transport protein 122
MISFSGDVQHDWNFRADISFAKVIGGPRGREGLLVALKDGSVYKLFINNPFPVLLVQHSCLVKSVDINVTRKRLAVVDNENICTVYDLFSKQILFQEPNTTSASWNLEVENLLTFSGNGTFSVKFGDITSFQRNIDGQVIGFKGNTVYCLDGNLVDLVDVPQSVPLDHYLEKGDFESAYKVACLGVAESDWNRIGKLALEQLNLEVAKKSFCRIRNFKYLETLRTLAKLKQEGRKETDLFLAEISSYCGNFYDVFINNVGCQTLSKKWKYTKSD